MVYRVLFSGFILKSFLFSFLFSVLFFLSGRSQDVVNNVKKNHINGNILYKNGEFGSFLNIYVLDRQRKIVSSQITDEKGFFYINNLPFGTLYFGIKRDTQLFLLKSFLVSDSVNEISLGEIRLPWEVNFIKEIKVQGKRGLVERRLDKIIVNISSSTLFSGNTANEILPKLPGVYINPKGELSIHGKNNVIILIDGKGQFISKDQLSQILGNLKSETLDKIEIISNPSSKYDSNGGPIINILTKKDSEISDFHLNQGLVINPVEGANGENKGFYGFGTNFNHGFGKLKIFSSFDFDHKKDYNDIVNTYYLISSNSYRNQEVFTETNRESLSFRLGFNTDLSKTLFFDGAIFYYKPLYQNYNKTFDESFFSNKGHLDSSIISVGQTRFINNLTSDLTFHLKKALKFNQNIDFMVDLNRYKFTNPSSYSNSYFNFQNINHPDFSSLQYLFNTQIESYKLDYSIDLPHENKLEAGVKVTFIKNAENQTNNLIESSNLTDSSTFTYKETVSGFYLNYSGSKGDFEWQIGTRIENTLSIGKSLIINNSTQNQYLNFFPAFTFQYNLPGKSNRQLEFSFNRRISRPGYESFNPSKVYVDQFNTRTGNANLNPEFSNNFELSYNYNSYSFSIYDTYNKSIKDLIPFSNSTNLTQTGTNAVNYNSNELGVSLSIPLKFAKWWEIYNSLDASWTKSNLYFNFINNYYSINYNLSQIFSFSNTQKLKMNLIFHPRENINYGYSNGIVNFALGYTGQFIERKLLFNINLNDVLGLNKLQYYQTFNGVSTSLVSLKNDRNLRFSISYKFSSGKRFSKRFIEKKGYDSEIRLQ